MLEGSEMPFLEHLEELRGRLIICLAALGATSIVGFFLSPRVLDWLVIPLKAFRPDNKLYFFGVAGGFLVRFKVGLALGVLLALPILFYEFWAFVSPALNRREKGNILPAAFASTILFALGILFCYYGILPLGIKMLLLFGTGQVEPLLEANSYLGFVFWFMLACGLIFEVPVVIVFLVRLGIVTPQFLRKQRRFAIVIAFIIGALTPTQDILSLFIQAGILIVLYEVGIWTSYLAVPRKERAVVQAGEVRAG
jgi:sec-independent protein translocase protein TatC